VLALDLPREIGRAPVKPALPAGAEDLLAQRAAARAGKDFGASDRLRAELAELGVAVADTTEGQSWSRTR
jgi:cysteinyl-tRNA synthetase